MTPLAQYPEVRELSQPRQIWHTTLLRLVNGARRAVGSATLPGSGTTIAVTFDEGEPDADYHLFLSGNAAETFWWSAKTASGFIVHSSQAGSTATVDWVLLR